MAGNSHSPIMAASEKVQFTHWFLKVIVYWIIIGPELHCHKYISTARSQIYLLSDSPGEESVALPAVIQYRNIPYTGSDFYFIKLTIASLDLWTENLSQLEKLGNKTGFFCM